jgi:hypothetical protein
MKRTLLTISLFVLFASVFSFGQSLTTYVDVEPTSVDPNTGVVQASPTVSVSGDDGGWCQLPETMPPVQGYTVPAVMMNGNTWQIGGVTTAGNFYPIQEVATFDTISSGPNDGPTDISVGTTLSGYCPDVYPLSYPPDEADNPFFQSDSIFVDGLLPNFMPGPCTIKDGQWNSCTWWGKIWLSIQGAATAIELLTLKFPIEERAGYTRALWKNPDPGPRWPPHNCFGYGPNEVCAYDTVDWCTELDSTKLMASYANDGISAIPLVDFPWPPADYTNPTANTGWDIFSVCFRPTASAPNGAWYCHGTNSPNYVKRLTQTRTYCTPRYQND